MYCKKCGNQLNEADKFCKNCGEPNGETKVETVKETVATPTQPSGNKDNKMLMIIACIIVVAALVVGGIFLMKDKDKDKNKKAKENNVNEFEDTNDVVPNIIDDDNDVTDTKDDTDTKDNTDVKDDTTDKDTNIQTSNDSITYKKFKFDKISGYTYTVGTSGLQITNSSDAIVLDIVAGNFDLVKTQRDKLNETFEKQGYSIKNTQLKNYGGVEYITAEVSRNGMNMLILYTKANDSYTYVIGLANKSYTVDYSMIYTANTIIKNASYVG